MVFFISPEIITERLERDFDFYLQITPGVVYKEIEQRNTIDLQNPSSLPDPTLIKSIEEPWIKQQL